MGKVFEDDGTFALGITSVVHDAERKLLFLDGVFTYFRGLVIEVLISHFAQALPLHH
jgi:hypothetical protein